MILAPILKAAPRGVVDRSKRMLYRQIPYRLSQRLERAANPGWRRRAERLAQSARQYQCVFIHVPKTAGMSLNQSLFGGHYYGNHHTIREYMSTLTRDEFERFFKFCVVRNPWDRVHSAFQFLDGGGLNRRDRHWAAREMKDVNGFRDFVVRHLHRERIFHSVHFRPQLDWITDPAGDIAVDMVARYERLGEDFALIRQRLGADNKCELQWVNRTPNKTRSYRAMYDDRMAAVIEDLYGAEIKLLGYCF